MHGENPAQELSAHIARFVTESRYEDIPAAVVDLGKIHILDTLACAVAGCVSPSSQIVRRYIAETGCSGASSVIGTEMRVPARFAAFLNGVAIHADDFDDTAPQPSADRNGGMHSTGSVVAAALALGEPRRISGRDFMHAVHIGIEVSSKLNHAVAPRHYESGYHATSTINIFGIAMAAGRILGNDERALRRSLGIAASQSSGLRENFGTMVNPFHSGHAAESATVSAELAARDFTAAENILEAPRGFFNAAAGGFDPDAIIGRLGKPWGFESPGMWIKPYPCGALTHPAITAMLDLVRKENIAADQIARIKVQTNQRIANTLIHNRPRSALQAKFSMPYALAMAVLRRRVSLAEYGDEVVDEPAVQSLIERVDYTPYDTVEPGYTNVTTLLDVTLTDGRRFPVRADFGKGNPRNPMTFTDIEEKLRGCAHYGGWGAESVKQIVDRVADLDNCGDIAALTRVLVRPTR